MKLFKTNTIDTVKVCQSTLILSYLVLWLKNENNVSVTSRYTCVFFRWD